MSRTSSHRQVNVVPYQREWVGAFERESTALLIAVNAIPLTIEHIGSTSIPGLCAKPIIDMLLIVERVELLDDQNRSFEEIGYQVMGEYGIDSRRYFRRDDERGNRIVHVHGFADGSMNIQRHLLFRDYLRAYPARAAEYGALKVRLAEEYPNDIEQYMNGKDALIKQIELEASNWASRT